MDIQETIDRLNGAIEELKDRLFDHDRTIIDRVGLGGKPSKEEKKVRSAIIRDLNRLRREHYRLTHDGGPPKKVNLTFTAKEWRGLEEEAGAEGVAVKQWLKMKLLDNLD